MHPMPQLLSNMAPRFSKLISTQYGARVQQVDIDTASPLLPTELKQVQDIVGTLLYYAQAVNPTLLAALSAIAAQ
jgi:hypothetical protein